MDRKHVYYSLSDFLAQAASDCLRLGFRFLLFNDEVFFVSPKSGLIDEWDDLGVMMVLEKDTIHRTGLKESDLFGDKWAQLSAQ